MTAADLGILECASLLRSRELSSVELTRACLARIPEEPTFEGAPDSVNAFVRVYPSLALETAAGADRVLATGDAPRVCGVPIAVKDLYGIGGLPLTASSRVLEGNLAPTDATAWSRLRAEGMVPLGHTHTHEFAAGGTTDQVGNPRALELVAGGSSGGSAAALAARMTPAALGTDTCGSLRIPSACCGTSTIKPTRGSVPLDGVIPLAVTLDHAGPMARTIADCAVLLSALTGAGYPLTARPGPSPLSGTTIAALDRVALVPEVQSGFQAAIDACARLGARVLRPAPAGECDWDSLTCILLTEAWRHHAQFAGREDRYRPAIAEFVQAAQRFTDQAAYEAAQARRERERSRWLGWFAEHGIDFVLEPTLPILPYPRGAGYDSGHAGGAGDPMIALTALWDMTGMPVAAVPVSWNVGVSLIAVPDREADLIQAAIDLQAHELGVP